MPCFQGIAVSIHTPDGPLPEYSIQRQNRVHRITSYIPVPIPKINPSTNHPQPSTFAISITLLTPGTTVPYSTPKATRDDPYPRPKLVGGLPNDASSRKYAGNTIPPYQPLTQSQNETIAAYIYFDGRPKEEVATLLRRGEETWVNSRWVSVPDSDGGGLAEREFLFREVGLERWLNGLDLQGKDLDIARHIKRRREKLEKRRRIKMEEKDSDEDSQDGSLKQSTRRQRNGILRYGDDKSAPVENISDDDSIISGSDSDDEPPMPEATGQIKVALFRVLASGEIKRGEYSPQFDAHDDDESENPNKEDASADVDHTTSFAKPKSLDPKSISTQTVSPIDMPDKPYAVFTFLYRGERQLQKMGILDSPAPAKPVSSTKRKSASLDFSNLQPLKAASTVKNFAGYRDANIAKQSPMRKWGKKRKDDDDDDAMESDEEDDDHNSASKAEATTEGDADKDEAASNDLLSPEDAARQKDLTDGVKKINLLKRQASTEPLATPAIEAESPNPPSPLPPYSEPSPTDTSNGTAAGTSTTAAKSLATNELSLDSSIASPFKRARNSESGPDGHPIDVSAAKKASEVFSATLFPNIEKDENSAKNDDKTMDDEL